MEIRIQPCTATSPLSGRLDHAAHPNPRQVAFGCAISVIRNDRAPAPRWFYPAPTRPGLMSELVSGAGHRPVLGPPRTVAGTQIARHHGRYLAPEARDQMRCARTVVDRAPVRVAGVGGWLRLTVVATKSRSTPGNRSEYRCRAEPTVVDAGSKRRPDGTFQPDNQRPSRSPSPAADVDR